MAELPKPKELVDSIDYTPPAKPWMETRPEFKPGTYGYGVKAKNLKIMGFPNQRDFFPSEEDWKLPENWKEIFLEGMEDRLNRFRSFRLFMDICVRCGACADKCHYFIGGGDPKNMPVLRAELLRSIYKKYFTWPGKILGKLAGARELTYDVFKEIWYYMYQCSECRRCSVFCPYGIDTCEITMMGRELMNLLGCNLNWIGEPVANCYRTGNHLGIEPQGIVSIFEFLCDELADITGVKVDIKAHLNRKGADILFIVPSGSYFADPGTYTMEGEFLFLDYLEKKYGLKWTMSTYASEGGNFGLFTSNEAMKRLNAKMYAEAKRLGVKWILGGECGHMWRVIHQYMATMNGPADFLEVPRNPITGTVFEHAKETKMVHICEFTADLIRHGKLPLDPSRNDHWVVTYHDSCNPSRGMGLLEEPRYIIKNVCNNFYEMPENTIREKTFCCGSGAGLGSEENIITRMRGGLPRANAVKYVHEKYGVNVLCCICAIDRASFPPLLSYWVPGVDCCGIHELVGNALVLPEEERGIRQRKMDLRGNPLKGFEDEMEEE